MPFLIRWKSEESTVTIRGQRVVASPLLDTHIKVQGVKGLADGDHPDLEIHTIEIPRSDIEYILEGVVVVSDDAGMPSTPEPLNEAPSPPKRKSATKAKPIKPRKSRIKSTKK